MKKYTGQGSCTLNTLVNHRNAFNALALSNILTPNMHVPNIQIVFSPFFNKQHLL